MTVVWKVNTEEGAMYAPTRGAIETAIKGIVSETPEQLKINGREELSAALNDAVSIATREALKGIPLTSVDVDASQEETTAYSDEEISSQSSEEFHSNIQEIKVPKKIQRKG